MARYNSVGFLPFAVIGGFLVWALNSCQSGDTSGPASPRPRMSPAPSPAPARTRPIPPPAALPDTQADAEPDTESQKPRERPATEETRYLGLGDTAPSSGRHRFRTGGTTPPDPGNPAPSRAIRGLERH